MPILEREEKASSAGVDVAYINKPVAGNIRIKHIGIHSVVASTDFVSAFAEFENLQKAGHTIPIGARIAQTPNAEGLSWDLDIEWPDDWRLKIDYYAQAAGMWYVTVIYNIIPEEKPKGWWG
jgi:hypothetical protein